MPKNHQKSLSLVEFAELKDVDLSSLKQVIEQDERIKPAFSRRNKDYYHEAVLLDWWWGNGHKVT
jgi:hypothetical protein